MKPVSIYYESIDVSLQTGPDICDITLELDQLVSQSDIAFGSLFATIVGSTGSITTIEFEPGVVEDLKNAINRLAPPDMEYEHEKAWHDGNGHSHVRASLVGPSLAVPFKDGKLILGTWQQIVFLELDIRPRSRTIFLQFMGE